MHTNNNGFSLIEIVITLVVIGVLMMLAIPSFVKAINNVQVRTAAESIQNALRLTQIEAAKRNNNVTLILTAVDDPTCNSSAISADTDVSASWIICDKDNVMIQRYSRKGGSNININSSFGSVTFDGLGRPSTTTGSIGDINMKKSGDICEEAGGNIRCLRLKLSSGGKVRMCDPMMTSGHPTACN